MVVNLDPELLSILVCPKCRSELAVDDAASELVCTNAVCALAYPVRADIPVLLIDEARDPHAPPPEPTAAAAEEAGDSEGTGSRE